MWMQTNYTFLKHSGLQSLHSELMSSFLLEIVFIDEIMHNNIDFLSHFLSEREHKWGQIMRSAL